jgi:hypothetical protein
VKLKDIIAGTRAIYRVRLPLLNVPPAEAAALHEPAADPGARTQAAAPQGQAAFSVDQASVEVGLRVLSGIETEELLKRAQAYAERNGSKRPVPGDPLYDFGLRVYTVALAAVDPDSDPKNPEPFFGERGNLESAVSAILESPLIGRDGILYLSQQHEDWQDLLNPEVRKLSLQQLWEKVGEVAASNDASPFFRLQPGLRWIFARFMATQLVSSPDLKFLFGSDSPGESSSSVDSPTT